MRRAGVVTVLVTGAAALFAACTDINRLPTVGGAERTHGARLLGVQLATPAERAVPLGAEIIWTFTAGPEGAASHNDDVGLTIVVPPGALQSTQTITVTALQGAAVAYRFEPHVTFNQTVRLVQDVSRIRSTLLLLSGGHFDGDAPQITNGKVNVTELVPGAISLLTGTVTIDVGHFSGWLVTTGNENPPKDSSQSTN